MKTISTFLFAFLITGLFGQSEVQAVYLNTTSVEYLTDISDEFSSVVSAVEKSYNDKDFNLATKTKSQVLTIVNKAASASQNLCNLLDMTLNSEAGAPERYEMSQADYQKTMSEDIRNQKLMVSKDESGDLAQYAQRLMAIRTQLKANKYVIHPNQERTPENIALLKQYSELLNKTAALYKTAQSRS